MPKLVISLPDAGEVIHELTEAKVTVGRVDDNTIQIDDASVSSHHAELVASGNDYLLTDLGSTNGTRHNGDEVDSKSRKLRAGDRVRFGKVEAIYETLEKSEPRPLPSEQAAPAAPAANSQRPGDFGNSSPFQRKRTKKNPINPISIAAAVVALLVFAASAYFVSAIPTPQF